MPRMPSTEEPDPEWTYVEPPTAGFTQVDVVRLLIQDNDPAIPLLSDLELQWLVDEWLPKHDSLYMVAAQAAERISMKFAGVVTVSADGVSVDVSTISERYRQAALDLRQTHKDAQVGGEVDIANLMWDPTYDWSIAPLAFGVGMHDNLEAGRQDYGTHRRGSHGSYSGDLLGGY